MIGAPVIVVASWSLFRGRRGIVVGRNPTMVQFPGEPLPLRFDDEALTPASSPAHFAGAE